MQGTQDEPGISQFRRLCATRIDRTSSATISKIDPIHSCRLICVSLGEANDAWGFMAAHHCAVVSLHDGLSPLYQVGVEVLTALSLPNDKAQHFKCLGFKLTESVKSLGLTL
jgi:hypothetical protein